MSQQDYFIEFARELGNAPTLAEFKAGSPKIAWTYQEEA